MSQHTVVDFCLQPCMHWLVTSYPQEGVLKHFEWSYELPLGDKIKLFVFSFQQFLDQVISRFPNRCLCCIASLLRPKCTNSLLCPGMKRTLTSGVWTYNLPSSPSDSSRFPSCRWRLCPQSLHSQPQGRWPPRTRCRRDLRHRSVGSKWGSVRCSFVCRNRWHSPRCLSSRTQICSWGLYQ